MVSAVIGTQWGDEGKAKVIDLLACNYDYVVRYQGGANAGHTVVIGDKKFIFHLLPSGLMNPNALVVIANGVVVDLEQLEEEIESLEALGFPTRGRVIMSDKAHIVMEYHKMLDQLRESSSPKKIGTTARGIGPCYEDKIARKGIKVSDLVNLSEEQLAEKIELLSREKIFLIRGLYNYSYDFDPMKLAKSCKEKFGKINIKITNTEILLNNEVRAGKNVLFEGAQGVLLDIDFGTYPYVTSSNASTNGIGSGAGVTRLDNVIGIVKAYTTRVGEGPFPTEQSNEIGEKLRTRGGEFGATTGRPRRCGWLDIPLLRYSTTIASVNEIFLTKLDVLSIFEEILVCTEYEMKGQRISIPEHMDPITLYSIKPIYKSFKGWMKDISDARKLEDLPYEARDYINFIETTLNIPVKYISVGPSREQTIII